MNTAYTFVYAPQTILNASTVSAEAFRLQSIATGAAAEIEDAIYLPGENKIVIVPTQEDFVLGMYYLESTDGLKTAQGEEYSVAGAVSPIVANDVFDGTVDTLSIRYYKNGKELYDITGCSDFTMCVKIVNNSKTEYKYLSYTICSSQNPDETISSGLAVFDTKGFAEFEVRITDRVICEGETLTISFEPLA